MTIFLTILKVIGWILLILLLVVLAALFILLFVPLRYRITGSGGKGPEEIVGPPDQGTEVFIRITWLCHIIGYEMCFAGEEKKKFIRILCFRKALKDKEEDDEDEDDEDWDEDLDEEDGMYVLRDEPPDKPSGKETSSGKDAAEDRVLADKKDRQGGKGITDEKSSSDDRKLGKFFKKKSKEEPEKEEAPENPPEPKKRRRLSPYERLKRKIFGILDKIKSIFQSILEKLRDIRDTVKKYYDMITDEGNHRAVKSVLREVFYLLKALKPTKMKVDAAFSTGSADTTGYAVAAIATLPFAYQKGWRVVPDFTVEEFYLKGTVDAKGRLFLFQVLGIIIRLILDKDCRKLFKEFK